MFGFRLRLVFLATAAIVALGAPSATAYHIPGTTYAGTHSSGGTVDFDVSPDGTKITRFRATNIPGNICTFTSSQITYTSGLPITNNSFSDPASSSPTDVVLTGSFTAKQTAAGTFSTRSPTGSGTCTSITVNWNATTTAPPDNTPPETTITSGPPGASNQRTVSFSFSATEAGVTFQCGLDGGALAPCTPPYTSGPLADGQHTFVVQAVDESGNADPTPASQPFSVDTAAPQTTITGGPARKTKSRTPLFRFGSNEPGSEFDCRLDRRPWTDCSSPKRYAKLPAGAHAFQVRATDQAGNTDPSPARRVFTITITGAGAATPSSERLRVFPDPSFSPAAPRAGAELQAAFKVRWVRPGAAERALKPASSSASCRATVSGSTLETTRQTILPGGVICGWLVPAGTAGKLLVIVVTVRSEGQTASRTLRLVIR